jgi:hypothetical protein
MSKERRRRTRVPYQITAQLSASGVDYPECETRNLSVNGVLILGVPDIELNTVWELELAGNLKNSSFQLRTKARAIRTVENGAAFAFHGMDEDCYALLQTVVIYNAENPLTVAAEFTPQFEPG